MQATTLGPADTLPVPRIGSPGEPRVLVIDDDAGVRDLIVTSLKSQGYRAVARRDAISGLVRLMSVGADVVVLDWRMPGLDGLDLLETLQRGYPEVPVVFMTGDPNPAVAGKARAAGAFGVLRKPFRIDDLLEQVRRAASA